MSYPYNKLNIPNNATISEIKTAYRQLVIDLFKNDYLTHSEKENQLKELNMAYNAIKTPKARKQYVKHGAVYGFATNPLNDLSGNAPFNIKNGKVKGRDISLIYKLSFAQAIKGERVDYSFECKIECEECVINQTACSLCDGERRIMGKRHVSFLVPAGTKTGDILKLKHMGEAGAKGASPGDLYVKFEVCSHEFFICNNQNDIYCKVPVLVDTLKLGGRINIMLPSETTVTLKLLPGNPSYQEIKYPHFGLTLPNGDVSDLYVKLESLLITNEQMNLSRKLLAKLYTLDMHLLSKFNKQW
ncbi:MAG: DnaJ C-terminal domain-containing protein [Candidatus Hodgkinia cicadicola]